MTLEISWETEAESVEDGEAVITASYHLLEFDAVLSEEHEAESEMTDHVVESSEAISDHKRAKPRALRLDVLVTNTPIGVPPPSGFGTRAISARVRKDVGNAKANVIVFSEEFDRVADVASTLDRLRAEAVDLTVATAIRTYERVQLLSVSIPRKEPEDAASFSLRFREVFRAETQTVDAPLPREPRGASRSETSSEPEDEEADSDEEDDSSWLNQAIGLLG